MKITYEDNNNEDSYIGKCRGDHLS